MVVRDFFVEPGMIVMPYKFQVDTWNSPEGLQFKATRGRCGALFFVQSLDSCNFRGTEFFGLGAFAFISS